VMASGKRRAASSTRKAVKPWRSTPTAGDKAQQHVSPSASSQQRVTVDGHCCRAGINSSPRAAAVTAAAAAAARRQERSKALQHVSMQCGSVTLFSPE
jgi:hypothetical protein